MDGNTEDLQKFVPQVHFEQIPIKNLCSNQDYQRNLSIKHVQRAAANFDLYQINPVKVSRRDGINYVFNGQHTIEIVALVSGSRETPVWCMQKRKPKIGREDFYETVCMGNSSVSGGTDGRRMRKSDRAGNQTKFGERIGGCAVPVQAPRFFNI